MCVSPSTRGLRDRVRMIHVVDLVVVEVFPKK